MKWPVVLAVTVVILVFGGITLNRTLTMFGCHDAIRQSVASVDGQFVAAVVERDCGATTAYSTLVFVTRAGGPFNPRERSPVFVIRGQNDVQLEWQRPGSLSVSYSPGKIVKSEASYDRIQLSYTERPVP